jgi:hypothetical protein
MRRDRMIVRTNSERQHPRMNIRHFAATVAILFLCMQVASAAEKPAFWLKDGDTVVFYGDSITEQTL